MKRLFSVITFATLVAMCLVACNQNEVKLHQDVGRIYGKATPTMGGDGIVFYVDDAAGYALVCSMNDLKRDRLPDQEIAAWERDFTWSVFGSDTLMERDTIWCKVTRSLRYFVDREEYDSINEHFLKYNFTEKDSLIEIYPMLRYKAYTEKGEQVCAPYTKDTAYCGFIGALIPADSVLRRIDSIWAYDSIRTRRDTIKREGAEDSIVTRQDTFNYRLDTIIDVYHVIAARYSDTLWNYIKKGDRNYPNANKWEYALDTNWNFGDIKGLGDDGKKNTEIIVNWDVPCRQKIEPDSSSAARTCYTYYTNNYYEDRIQYGADTAYKAGQGEWYLPSREELKKLFDARKKINEQNAGTKGFEPLENCYWSSNQRDAKNAWYKCFSDNGVESYIPKANNNYRVNVRAIRRVDWPLK